MKNPAKLQTAWMIWIVFDQLWRADAQNTIPVPGEAPDWDLFLSHFAEGLFYRAYRLVWDHSAWCDAVFNCKGPQGEVVRHQMCIYTWSLEFGTDCRNYNQVKVHDTEFEKVRLLDTHNNYREEVALHGINKRFWGASNIRRMTWDYSLEDMAINWGLQCYKPGYKDNACRRIHGFDYASLLMERHKFPTNVTWPSEYIVEQWAASLARYDYRHPHIQELHSNYSKGPWDRATQMLWHSTYKVGCGVVSYTSRGDPTDRSYHTWYFKTVLCYYAPPGNKIGQEIFKEGAPGLCPEGTGTRLSCAGADYQYLCHNPDDPLDKKLKVRTRSRGFPPVPLYSQFVDATVTDTSTFTTPTEAPDVTPGTFPVTGLSPKARNAMVTRSTIDEEPIEREGGGTKLLPSLTGLLPTFVWLMRVQG